MTPIPDRTPPPVFAGAPVPDRAAIGQARAQARVRRTRMIRRRVAAWAAGLFAAAWLGIAVQLVSGHDPALSKTNPTSAAAVSTASSSGASGSSGSTASGSSGTSGSTSSGSSGSGSTSSGSTSSGSSGSAVTTRQS